MTHLKSTLTAVAVAIALVPGTARAVPARWVSHGPGGGTITTLLAGPDGTAYAGTFFAGLFRTTDVGATWGAANDGLPVVGTSGIHISAIAVDPSDPAILYVGTGVNAFRSTDDGSSWRRCGPLPQAPVQIAVAPSDQGVVYAAVPGSYPHHQVFRSGDACRTWEALRTPVFVADVSAIAIDPADADRVYLATTNRGVARTVDGGITWAGLNDDLPTMTAYGMVMDPGAPDTLYLAAGSEGVYKTTNGGTTWDRMSAGLGGTVYAIAADPATPGRLYVGVWTGVYRTIDGAAHWTALTNGPTVAVSSVAARAGVVLAGTQGYEAYRSGDGGDTWAPADEGLAASVTYAAAVDPFDPEKVLAGAFGLWWSPDRGRHWFQDPSLPAVAVLDIAVDPGNRGVWYLGTNEGVVRTTDGGRTWQHAHTGIPPHGQVNDVALDPATPGTVYAAILGSGVFKSVDGGAHWERTSSGITTTVVNNLAVSASDPSILYVATNADVFKSEDGGVTWARQTHGFADPYIRDVAVDPTSPSVAYASNNNGVYVTTDGGAHWTLSNAGLTDPVVQTLLIDPSDPATVYAGNLTGERGAWVSHDHGATWTAMSTGLTSRDVTGFARDAVDGTLYASTWGGGVFAMGTG